MALFIPTQIGTLGNDIIHGVDNPRVFNLDIIDGLTGNDALYGHLGNDVLIGDEGNDRLEGGAGDDILFGGLQVIGSEVKDFVLRQRFDYTSYAADPGGVEVTLADGTSGGTARDGYGGTDTLYDIEGVIGSAFNDVLNGNLGNNILRGARGDDTVFGRDGNDRLFGEYGNDILSGGNGHDVVNGGQGPDRLVGGWGNDRFVFTEPERVVDVIIDFDQYGDDKLVFEDLLTGVFDYRGTASFTGSGNSEARFIEATQVLQVDTGGDAGTDIWIKLRGVTAADISASDFLWT